jgi:hypothetical protein
VESLLRAASGRDQQPPPARGTHSSTRHRPCCGSGPGEATSTFLGSDDPRRTAHRPAPADPPPGQASALACVPPNPDRPFLAEPQPTALTSPARPDQLLPASSTDTLSRSSSSRTPGRAADLRGRLVHNLRSITRDPGPRRASGHSSGGRGSPAGGRCAGRRARTVDAWLSLSTRGGGRRTGQRCC